MNYCNLSEKLNMTPLEVFNLLNKAKDVYYDLDKKLWQSENLGNKLLRVLPRPDEGFPITNPLCWFDQYAVEVTNLSWIKLVDYFKLDFEVHNIEQAAFLLDMSDKNCIEINPTLFDRISKHRTENRLMFFDASIRPYYDSKEFLLNCNKLILEVLNLVVSETSFMRV